MSMFISGSSTSTGSFHELHIKDKIGIGTASPNSIGTTGATTLSIQSPSTSGVIELQDANAGTDAELGKIEFQNLNGGSSVTGRAIIIGAKEGSTHNSTKLQFYTMSSGTVAERMRISSAGNVGINRTNPGYKFEVGGVILGTGGVYSYERILAGNSTDGLPSFAFANDPDTGFRSDLSDNMRFITDATVKMVLNSSGNLGIGTTSPSAKLQIQGGGVIVSGSNDTSAIQAMLVKTSAASSQGLIGVEGNTAGAFLTNTLARATILSSTANSTPLQLGSSGNIKMTILGTANGQNHVGIGTTAPITSGMRSSLHVYGNSYGLNTSLKVEADGGGSSAIIQIDSAADRSSTIQFQENGTNKAHITNDASADALVLSDGAFTDTLYIHDGNVGIGAENPVAKFQIGKSSATGLHDIRIENSSAVAKIGVAGGGSDIVSQAIAGDLIISNYTGGTKSILFGIGTAEKMRVDHTGNVGIGVTDPDSPLEIYHSTDAQIKLSINTHGDAGIMNGNADGLMIYGKGAANQIRFYSNTTEKMRVDSTGVGIGFVSPTEALHVNGNIKATGTLAISGYSDVGSAITSLTSGGISKSGTPVDNQVAVFTSANQVEGSSNLTFASNVLTVGGDITATGKITAQEFNVQFVSSSILFSTGSNIFGDSTDDTHTFTGNVNISGSSTSSLFTVDGTQGRLFGVTDELSGSLFSANTISGLPVIEAFSDNKVTLGPFSSPIEVTNVGNLLLKNNKVISFEDSGGTARGIFRLNSSDRTAIGDATSGEVISIVGGRVGIGSTSPHANSKLNVENTSGIAMIYITSAANNDTSLVFEEGSTAKWMMGHDNSNSDAFTISDGNGFASGTKFTMLSSGNVGIGTVNPSRKLEVSSDTDTYVEIATTAGGSDTWLYFRNDGDNDAATDYRMGRTNTGNFILQTGNGNTSLLLGTSAGNIGIGMTPTTKFSVKSAGDGNDQISLIHSGNTVKLASLGQLDSHGNLTLRQNNGQEKIRLHSSGSSYINTGFNFGIGDTSPSHKLDVSGDALVTGNLYIGSSNSRFFEPSSNVIRTDDRLDVTGGILTNSVSNYSNQTLTLGNALYTMTIASSQIYVNNGDIIMNPGTNVSGSSTSTGSFGTLNLGSTSPNIDFFAPANNPAAIRFTEGGTSLTELTYDGSNLRLKSNYANRDIYLDTPNGDLMIDSTNGNVGIGLTSPQFKLHISGSTDLLWLQGSGAPQLRMTDNSATSDGDTFALMDFAGMDHAGSSAVFNRISNVIVDNTQGTTDSRLTIHNHVAGTLTEVLSVASGKVGIGTTNPGTNLLQVFRADGTNSDDYTMQIYNADTTSDQGHGLLIRAGNDSSDIPFIVRSRDNNTTYLKVNGAGKVGIGVDPTHNFNLRSSGNVEFRIQSTDNDARLQISSDNDEGQDSILEFLSNTSTRGSILYDHNTTANSQKMDFKVGDNAVTAMTILGNGHIGIGEAVSGHILNINSGDTIISLTETGGNSGAFLDLGRAKGTVASPTDLNEADLELGRLRFLGRESSALRVGAFISAFTSGVWNGGDYRSYMTFNVAQNGSINPTERMRITAEGQVGIANTSPESSWASADDLIVGNTSQGSSGITIMTTTSGDGNLHFGDSTDGSSQAYVRYDHNQTKMIFATENVQHLFLDGSGNLGIGGSPSTNIKLDAISAGDSVIASRSTTNSSGNDAIFLANVAGSSAGDPMMRFNIDNVGAWSIGVDNSDSDKFKISGLSAVLGTNDRLVIDTSGNVGIGLDNPSEMLNLRSSEASASPVILLENTNSNNLAPQLNFYNASSSPADDDFVGQIDFEGRDSGGNRTEYARIIASAQDVTDTIEDGMLRLQTMFNGTLTDGLIIRGMAGGAFVGIGETNPAEEMHLKGAEPKFRIENSSDSGKYFNMHLASGGGVSKLRFDSETHTNTLLVTNNNRVGIGAGAPAVNLHIESSQTDTDFTNNSVVGGSSIIISNQQSLDNTFSSLQFIAKETGGNDQSAAIVVESTSAKTFTPKLHIVQRTASNTQSARLTVDESGNVGIGTTDPNRLLTLSADVSGETQQLLLVNKNDTDGDTSGILFGVLDNATYAKAGIFFERTTSQGRGSLHFATDNATDTGHAVKANARMTITNDGNVGIGTTDPSAISGDNQLHLHKSDSGHNYIHFTNGTTGVTDSDGFKVGINGGEQGVIWNNRATDLIFGTSNSERMRIHSNGKVGINTSNPLHQLDVDGTTRITGVLTADGHIKLADGSNFYLDGGSNTYIKHSSSDVISFYTGGIQRFNTDYQGITLFANNSFLKGRMTNNAVRTLIGLKSNNTIGIGHSGMEVFFENGVTIESGGDVGIGTTSPSYKLDVDGDARIQHALGVGTTPNATDGRIDAANDVVAYSTSDERLKENVKLIENPIEKVKKIRGVEFDWKPLTDEEKKSIHGNEGHDVGVIAQDVEKVLPEVVTERENGYKAVKYEKMVSLLIEGMKEQQKQIEELKSEIQELKDGSSK